MFLGVLMPLYSEDDSPDMFNYLPQSQRLMLNRVQFAMQTLEVEENLLVN